MNDTPRPVVLEAAGPIVAGAVTISSPTLTVLSAPWYCYPLSWLIIAKRRSMMWFLIGWAQIPNAIHAVWKLLRWFADRPDE